MTPKNIMTILTSIFLIVGLYVFWGSLRNRTHFNKAPKRIDLIEFFGVFGRLLYAILGFLMIIASILALLAYNNIGPLSPYLGFDK